MKKCDRCGAIITDEGHTYKDCLRQIASTNWFGADESVFSEYLVNIKPFLDTFLATWIEDDDLPSDDNKADPA